MTAKKMIAMAAAAMTLAATSATAQQRIHYSGTELSDPARHDGGLRPAIGVHNIQTMRAWREHPAEANGWGWTYNHQPMMAYWHGRFYLHYLSDPKDEHVPPSRTLLQTSDDGYHWSAPRVLFPEYRVPEGYSKPGQAAKAHGLTAIMHQRVGFFVSKDGILLATGNYGVALHPKDDPNDGNGIGRVVREIRDDGSLGPIYFIYYNHAFGPHNTDYPHYTKAPRRLRRACEELLASPRQRMQWAEEADRGDTIVPLQRPYKAYCDYTLPDGRLACLWKHALTSVSSDRGRTWAEPIARAQGFVNSNAKIWGQRLADGTYATVYNPSEYRWPLAISLSSDGLDYTTLNLVCGEVPPMRYGGNYKSYGPQYARGIQEGNGTPRDSNLWVAYSMNKEDIWVARIPVPVQTQAHAQADDDFARYGSLAGLTQWNIYSPLAAPVSIEGRWLTLADGDAFDHAVAERMIPPSRSLRADFDLRAGQADHGTLQIEFADGKGTVCSRIDLNADGTMTLKGGARYKELCRYEPGRTYHVTVILSATDRTAEVLIDGRSRGKRMLFSPVAAIERITLRTGQRRTWPTPDTPADFFGTLPGTADTVATARFSIARLRTRSYDADAGAAFLKAESFKHYIDFFNSMEQEDIVQAVPNDSSWQWLSSRMPLFECPDRQMELTYYYRWWTLRKHIRRTDGGWAMTEFLVPRSYADRHNLIASALGHHIMESRWLRDTALVDAIVDTWYHGNGGQPMAKLHNYSSWTAAALWERYKADGRKAAIVGLLGALGEEYRWWKSTHRLPSGLYWQADVQDAMEESISGGRKKRYARPSINSYMYGNARALAAIARLAADTALAARYDAKADMLRRLVTDSLWNARSCFFETRRGDTLAAVREAIGFIPWYFNLPPADGDYGKAWLQAADTKGFSAPRGLTTAERRHPLFRSHGTGRCEWDGAVWPFATSQTLTAMANYICNYPNPSIGDSLFFSEMKKYTESHSHRGRPYIGEYLDETTGYWLMGDRERSRYYNHSTYCDLIITGVCGLRPRADGKIEVRPLVPRGAWPWFCLDNVPYHGRRLCIVWDEDGSRYHAGPGLHVFVDGVETKDFTLTWPWEVKN